MTTSTQQIVAANTAGQQTGVMRIDKLMSAEDQAKFLEMV
jgi:hypothetical protein